MNASPPGDGAPTERYEDFVDPVDGTRWRIDVGFALSNWTCIWGRGCEGILNEPAADLQQGCCSVGAEMISPDEARRIHSLGRTLDPARFQFHEAAEADGVFADEAATATRIVDGACIFLNRPGFAGGAGCALQLAAIDEGDNPIDWKPSVCWQLPLKIERRQDETPTDGPPSAERSHTGADPGGDSEVRTLRRWRRADWGTEGATMAWCCTEVGVAPDGSKTASEANAYVGDQTVAESMFDELSALVGPEVAVELRSRARGSAQEHT